MVILPRNYIHSAAIVIFFFAFVIILSFELAVASSRFHFQVMIIYRYSIVMYKTQTNMKVITKGRMSFWSVFLWLLYDKKWITYSRECKETSEREKKTLKKLSQLTMIRACHNSITHTHLYTHSVRPRTTKVDPNHVAD